MAITANYEKMTSTAREMAEAQRDSFEAVTEAFSGLQRRNADLARQGAEFMRIQERNARVAQEWFATGVKVLEGQQRGAEAARKWFNSAVEAMREQTQQNLRAAEVWNETVRTQQEGVRYFWDEWARLYRNFVFSPFLLAQENVRVGQRAAENATRQGIEVTQQAVDQGLKFADETSAQTEEVLRRIVEATREVELQTTVHAVLGTEDYEKLNVGEIGSKLDKLTIAELVKVREYEKRTKNRESLVEQIDRKIKAAS